MDQIPDVQHTPVMVQEVLDALHVSPEGVYIDCTVGDGGHAIEVLGASTPAPRLLGIDLDAEALRTASDRLGAGDRVVLSRCNFAGLAGTASSLGFFPADGVLFDLGVSSRILSTADRGFSFSKSGPLDMRFDGNQSLTASHIVNYTRENDLADIIYKYGEETMSRRIARAIVKGRPMETTAELARVVYGATRSRRSRGIHPATRTFQAIRMAVNKELDSLKLGLEEAVKVLRPGGRMVVISYHSLEDRLVKRKLARESSSEVESRLRLINRKVIKPSRGEISSNPRSRSAKMRVAERV